MINQPANTLADALIALGQLTLRFGRVDRITFHEDGVTPESDTDHTVMLGLIACALAADTCLDVGLVAQYALVHDLVEVYAGDTPTLRLPSAEAKAEKVRREHAAFMRIASEFDADLPWLPETISGYEAQVEPEARFVRALDKLLPKITHVLNGLSTVRQEGMTLGQLRDRYDAQERELREYAADFPIIFELRADLIDRVMDLAVTVLSRAGAVA